MPCEHIIWRNWQPYLNGVLASSGEVLVFLDSHCEVNVMWLQPLLAAIQQDQRTVVCPVIDIISADTLAYSSSPVVRGGFNWGLHFKWDLVPLSELGGPEGATAPIKWDFSSRFEKFPSVFLQKRKNILKRIPSLQGAEVFVGLICPLEILECSLNFICCANS